MLRSDLSVEDQLQRQININMQLRRQLETARRDAVEYCAKFCEEHEVESSPYNWGVSLVQTDVSYIGNFYAKGLRGIIGK